MGLDPVDDLGPDFSHRDGTDNQSEVSGTDGIFVDIFVCDDASDGADGGGTCEFIFFAKDIENGGGESSKRRCFAVDDEATGEEAVIDDKLIDKGAQGRTGPCNKAFAPEKSAFGHDLFECFFVVEEAKHFEEVFDFLFGADEFEAIAIEDAGDAFDFVDGTAECVASGRDDFGCE